MITLKLTSFNGNTKAYHLPTQYAVEFFIAELEKALPKNVVLHASCDALGISGHLKGLK